MNDCASVQNSGAWQWNRDFVGAKAVCESVRSSEERESALLLIDCAPDRCENRSSSCVLFFDISDEVEMFHVPSGSSLDELLGNTFGFVFYVTDTNATYLLSFNDHDFLICCGSARKWLEQRDLDS